MVRNSQIFLYLLFVFVLTGCSSFSGGGKNTVICDSPYLDNTPQTAETYYEKLKSCLNNDDQINSVAYFALGGVQTWYDADKNPGTMSVERHKKLLKNTLAGLGEDKSSRFWSALNTSMQSDTELKRLCNMVIAHTPGGNESEHWQRAATGYIYCPDLYGWSPGRLIL